MVAGSLPPRLRGLPLKSVLMVAYLFPPTGGAGVQRTLKFAKYLPETGWRPLVLTARPDLHRPQDPELLDELPKEVLVRRTGVARLPAALPFRLRDWISRWLLVVDEQVGWLPIAIREGQRWIQQLHPDVIYSTSSPYTCHLAAQRLSQSNHLPWVADFRDPWVAGLSDHFPTPLHRRRALRLEAGVFESANRVVLNTERALAFYRLRYPHLPPDRMSAIPNGFDGQDTTPTGSQNIHAKRKFTLVHSGTLYQKTRSGCNLVRAVSSLVGNGHIPADAIELHFYGNLDPATRQELESSNLSSVIQQHGYVSHRESLQALQMADLLVLIPSTGAGSELYIPAKLYEYLAAGKPILAMAEAGAAADLVNECGAGIVLGPHDTSAVAEVILSYYHRWRSNQPVAGPNPGVLARYDRRALTFRLAQIFDELAGEGR